MACPCSFFLIQSMLVSEYVQSAKPSHNLYNWASQHVMSQVNARAESLLGRRNLRHTVSY